MKNFLKQLGKAICYFLLYFGVQNIIGFVYMMVYIIEATVKAAGEGGPDVEAISLGAVEYLMQKQNSLVIISGIITILFLTVFFLIRRKNVLTESGVKKTQGKYIPIAIGLGVGYMLIINFGLCLLPESWLMAYSEQSSGLVEGSAAAIIVSTMIMAPFIEEIIFRGLMLSRLRKGMPDVVAVLICALIFGLAHGQILWMTYAFGLGIVLGLVAVKSDSVIPGLILHMVFNICGVVVPSLLGEVVAVEVCVVMVVIGVLLTAALLAILLRNKKPENEMTQTA